MLVNASASPSAAIWLGLMLIGLAAWIFLHNETKTRSDRNLNNGFFLFYTIFISLIVWII